MQYDWNSFYGTFAQASGALIGIIAAFLISRLLSVIDSVEKMDSELNKLQNRFTELQNLLDKRYFQWYSKNTLEGSFTLDDEIKAGTFDELSEEEILEKVKTDYGLYDEFDVDLMEIFNKKYEEATRTRFGLLAVSKANLIGELSNEKEIINTLEAKSYTLIDEFKRNKYATRLFKGKFKALFVLIFLLLVAFPLTVIYPMHFLPIPNNQQPTLALNWNIIITNFSSLKGVLLTLFFLLFEGAFIYFAIILFRANAHVDRILNDHSIAYSDIKSYSPHFRREKSILDDL